MSLIQKLIPAKYTGPTIKFIRTTEFFILAAANAALVVLPIVSSGLTEAQAVKYGVILNGGSIAARTVLKFGMILKNLGLDPVKDPNIDTSGIAADTQKLTDVLKQSEQALADAKSEIEALKSTPVEATAERAPSLPQLTDDQAAAEIQEQIDKVNPLLATPQDLSRPDGKEVKKS